MEGRKSLLTIKTEHIPLDSTSNSILRQYAHMCERCTERNLFVSKENSGNNLSVYWVPPKCKALIWEANKTVVKYITAHRCCYRYYAAWERTAREDLQDIVKREKAKSHIMTPLYLPKQAKKEKPTYVSP